jgi:hypothetical protein
MTGRPKSIAFLIALGAGLITVTLPPVANSK